MHLLTPGQTIRHLAESPLIRPALLAYRRAQYRSEVGAGAYYGVFATFDEARKWLPQTPEFDCTDLAAEYVQVRSRTIFEYDYPVLWRLDQALSQGLTRILDIGGSVGVHYHAYRSLLPNLDRATWHVVEVPAMVTLGRSIAAARRTASLSFDDDLSRALCKAHDVWISAGALQYIDLDGPEELLRQSPHRPLTILLNKLPLYDGADFVTTQNLGSGCFAPVHVYNRHDFIDRIEGMGYALADGWPVHERSLYLPGHPERSIPTFSGLYFKQTSLG